MSRTCRAGARYVAITTILVLGCFAAGEAAAQGWIVAGLGSYVDLGDSYYDGPAFGGFTDTLTAKGWDISVLGMFPLNPHWGLYASLGMFRWDHEVRYRDPSGDYNYDESGTDPSFGFGGSLSFGPNNSMGVHLGYQRFKDVGDDSNSGHQYDRSFTSFGYHYRFGVK